MKGIAVELTDLILIVVIFAIVLVIFYDLIFQQKIGNEACHVVADSMEHGGAVLSTLRKMLGPLGINLTPLPQVCDAVIRW
jgi:hypothetical protein